MATHRVSGSDIVEYAELSHDRNPLHVDPEYARRRPFGGVVAHGFLMLGPVLADLSGRGPPLELRVRFRRPLRPGREATSVWERSGAFTVSDDDETLAEGAVTFGPHAAETPQEEGP